VFVCLNKPCAAVRICVNCMFSVCGSKQREQRECRWGEQERGAYFIHVIVHAAVVLIILFRLHVRVILILIILIVIRASNLSNRGQHIYMSKETRKTVESHQETRRRCQRSMEEEIGLLG